MRAILAGEQAKPLQSIIYLVIFFEGFVSIAMEVLTIRQLIPFVGSSVIITSIVIGIFLLFLAWGYHRGGKHQTNLTGILKINLTIACLILGVGLSVSFLILWFLDLFANLQINSLIPLITYLLIIVAPLSYVLGQTLPITMNLLPKPKLAGELGGRVLAISTVGSFLGAVLTTLWLMNWFGVAITVFINAVLLGLLTLLLSETKKSLLMQTIAVLVILVLVFIANVTVEQRLFVKTDNYANYQITQLKGNKVLSINLSPSSMVGKDKKGFKYIEVVKNILFNQLKLRNKDVLVLGAGGFSLSAEQTDGNHFTYVDIDKKIKSVVVPGFQKQVNGSFVGKDARVYLQQDKQHYAVIFTDTYSNKNAIPSYLLTTEFFQQIKRHLKPNGVALFNIIANPMLTDSYSKTIDNTLRRVFGSCMSIPLNYANQFTNIIYLCSPNRYSETRAVYTDNINTSSLDYFIAKEKN